MTKYIYGMRVRGRGFGCQPNDFIDVRNDEKEKYYDILSYERQLTNEEILKYSLDFIEKVEPPKKVEDKEYDEVEK